MHSQSRADTRKIHLYLNIILFQVLKMYTRKIMQYKLSDQILKTQN